MSTDLEHHRVHDRRPTPLQTSHRGRAEHTGAVELIRPSAVRPASSFSLIHATLTLISGPAETRDAPVVLDVTGEVSPPIAPVVSQGLSLLSLERGSSARLRPVASVLQEYLANAGSRASEPVRRRWSIYA